MKLIVKILLVFVSISCRAQKQGNIWHFGNGAGLDFNNVCTPELLTDGMIDGAEGCATISDKTSGQLLFYTNSDSVWNRNHKVMPNGHLVTNGKTITQVMIISKPTSPSQYYIVTSEVQGFSGEGLRFHGIDMTLNGGLGGLSFKDSLLYISTPVAEKITAVQHANGTDIWLLAHEYGSNTFLSFLITSAGINTTPIISQLGKIHGDASTIDAIGELKASPDGKKLAVVTSRQPNIELFDFDNSNGQISNLITLPERGGYDTLGNPSGLYGISFSSNNSMLYVSKWNLPSLGSPGQIIQFDIASNDSAIINNSRINIFTSTSKSFYSLQLAPNRKIYVGQNANSYIGVIDFPDSLGLNCNYSDNGLYLNGKTSSWGLNNLMENSSYCTPTGMDPKFQATQIILYPNPSNGTFSVNLKDDAAYSLDIFNMLGDHIYSAAFARHQKSHDIDISTQPEGVYFVRISTNDDMVTRKVIVVK